MKLRRLKKPSTKIDESVITESLQRHWRNNYDARVYLNKRFPDGDATGDFLKSIIALRDE